MPMMHDWTDNRNSTVFKTCKMRANSRLLRLGIGKSMAQITSFDWVMVISAMTFTSPECNEGIVFMQCSVPKFCAWNRLFGHYPNPNVTERSNPRQSHCDWRLSICDFSALVACSRWPLYFGLIYLSCFHFLFFFAPSRNTSSVARYHPSWTTIHLRVSQYHFRYQAWPMLSLSTTLSLPSLHATTSTRIVSCGSVWTAWHALALMHFLLGSSSFLMPLSTSTYYHFLSWTNCFSRASVHNWPLG